MDIAGPAITSWLVLNEVPILTVGERSVAIVTYTVYHL